MKCVITPFVRYAAFYILKRIIKIIKIIASNYLLPLDSSIKTIKVYVIWNSSWHEWKIFEDYEVFRRIRIDKFRDT